MSTSVVIGGGLAGCAVAAGLARRGWDVTVLDAAPTPASGASGLPVGLFAPHVSADDCILSQLSRHGISATLEQCQTLLQTGVDWAHTGVLQLSLDGAVRLPRHWDARSASRLANTDELAQAGLPGNTTALWHTQAGWIKPANLVRAWLKQPGIRWQGNSCVTRLLRQGSSWYALDSRQTALGQADLVIVAAGHHSATLIGSNVLSLQPIRGQVTWGLHTPDVRTPTFPVNGHGHFIPHVPTAAGHMWLSGSTFERDNNSCEIRACDQQANWQQLHKLLPYAAQQLSTLNTQAWAGVRCATPNRLPVMGQLQNGLWVCTGMGSRGLTFAALCAELLACELHHSPWPIEKSLALRFLYRPRS